MEKKKCDNENKPQRKKKQQRQISRESQSSSQTAHQKTQPQNRQNQFSDSNPQSQKSMEQHLQQQQLQQHLKPTQQQQQQQQQKSVPLIQNVRTQPNGSRNVTPSIIPRENIIKSVNNVLQQDSNSKMKTELVRVRGIDSDILLKSRPPTLQTKQGQLGRKINLQANFFRISEGHNAGLNQYHVDFTPGLDTKYRKQIISNNKGKFGGYIFDGTKIYTKLSFDDFEFTTKSSISDELIKVNIKFVGAIHLHDIEWLQLYNIIVRRCMDGLKLQLIGRNLFNAMNKIQLKEFNLEIWPGYITSFRQHERDILLCCDIVHKVMRNESILHILRRLIDQSDHRRMDAKTLAKNELLGAIVLTDYNNKTYRIDDIDFESNPKSLFLTSNGNISYVDYYKNRYNLKINDIQQPLLITKPTGKQIRRDISKKGDFIKLVPELCRATGLTDGMKNNQKLMTSMASYTRVNPEQRVQRLQSFQQSLCKSKESASVLQEFNLKIDPDLIEIPGRVLPESTLTFGAQKQLKSFQWEKCFITNALLQGSQSQSLKWIVIIPNERCAPEAKHFAKTCQDTGRKMGFYMKEPEFLILTNENNMTYATTLEQACLKDPQIIMVFVNSPRADLYSCIKKKLTCDRAVPSQVIKISTIKRTSGLLSVATKVCVQMSAKLCFAPWSVAMPDNIMCIGFDVCHSTRDRTKSYGAIVATMDVNKKPGIYFSAVSEHIKGNEMSNDIALNVIKALRQYYSEHKKLPSIIFFYRDGVGDGQLHQVYEHEVSHVVKSIENCYSEYKTVFKLSYIVVSKRINTRIFSNNDGRKNNPEPGTVVDDIVTLPQRYDFYLVSQCVRQGTVSPTSYNVLYDNTRLSPDKIQDMTYRQTHMYYNYFATVRVPAVCQYAHKLAFLVGQYLHQSPNVSLEKKLYFL